MAKRQRGSSAVSPIEPAAAESGAAGAAAVSLADIEDVPFVQQVPHCAFSRWRRGLACTASPRRSATTQLLSLVLCRPGCLRKESKLSFDPSTSKTGAKLASLSSAFSGAHRVV